MRICLYSGCRALVKRSGVGEAVNHQKEMLRQIGAETTDKWLEQSDIIHFNTVFPDSSFAAWLAKRKKRKVVYYGHSTMEDFRNSFKGSNFFAPLFRKWIIHCYERGDIIITPTEYSRMLLKSYGIKKPIYSLSNGVDTGFFAPSLKRRLAFREKWGLNEQDKVVLSVGHYIERKGILDFLELARRFPDVKFFWYGYTSLNIVPKNIRTAIENAPENVTFPGYVTREELREAYCGCDLFAFLSHEETEGIVVLEALACGIACLVRDIPVYRDWLSDGVNVYKAATFKEFCKKSDNILCGDLPSLSTAGLDIAYNRSMIATGKKLMQIYINEGLVQRAKVKCAASE